MLEDVERIEVIRGPGATLWGANAVNGIVNVITKSAAETSGGLVTAGVGDENRGLVSLRQGGALSDRTKGRLYVKYRDQDGAADRATGDDVGDDWHSRQAGFRLDGQLSPQHGPPMLRA